MRDEKSLDWAVFEFGSEVMSNPKKRSWIQQSEAMEGTRDDRRSCIRCGKDEEGKDSEIHTKLSYEFPRNLLNALTYLLLERRSLREICGAKLSDLNTVDQITRKEKI